jgi:hypothetical protein
MKAAKHMVLLGGVVALAAWFLPYVLIDVGDGRARMSAFADLHGTQPGIFELSSPGYLVLVFAPVLLLVLGAFAEVRRGFGRRAGTIALLIGLWAIATGEHLRDLGGTLGELELRHGLACDALLVAGALGALGGLLAILSPDRRTI